MEDDVELHDNRTELERLLAAAWEDEHRRPRKTRLPMWLFAIALPGAVLSTYALSHAYTAVMSALVTTGAKPIVDPVAAANVAEDIDYRIAQRTKSLVGWQAFLEAHRDGPHAQAAHAEIERLLPTPPPEADAGQQAVATGKAEQRDALATAANAPQVLDPKPIERQLKPQETEEVEAAAPIVSDRADSPTSAGVRAVEAPQMNGSNESSGVPLVKDEATPSGESGETVGRRVRRGAHHGGWHYRIHTTGVARMGPVLVFR
jgi:hypothetical protein